MPKAKPAATDQPRPEDELLLRLQEWQDFATKLKACQDEERKARISIADYVFGKSEQRTEGTSHKKFKTSDGREWDVKVVHKINRGLDVAALDSVMSQLPEDSRARNIGVVVKYVPELVVKGYKELSDQERLIVAQAVTEKAGMPELAFDQVLSEGEPMATTAAAPAAPRAPGANAHPGLIEVDGKFYAAHPMRSECGEWVNNVVIGQGGTTSFEVRNLGSCFEVIWNGVPVDPMTGQPCQLVNTPVMDKYHAEKNAGKDPHGLPPAPGPKAQTGAKRGRKSPKAE